MKLLINEKQLQVLIREEIEMSELRRPHFNFVKEKVKQMTGQDWPEYVLLDWLYKGTKDYSENDTPNSYRKLVKVFVEGFLYEFGPGEWKFENIDISIDTFEPNTQTELLSRDGGSKNPYNVPNDEERHSKQSELIKKRGGPSNEPIIVVKFPNGLHLLEGWHRTIQSLKEFETYRQPAYVYYPKN
jgi:hypothetical protein